MVVPKESPSSQHEVVIMKGYVTKDYVHLMVSIRPQVSISCLMQWLKARGGHHLIHGFAHLKKMLRSR
jgi:putative transposase